MALELDHLVIAATDLESGTAAIEEALGVALSPGGNHSAMSTHNRLLGLGPVYLEVIAIDPSAPAPGRPRWYALDDFTGPARLTHWAARDTNLAELLAAAPTEAGQIMDFARGDLTWQMAVPATGHLPLGGAFPALLQWHGTAHPCQRLEDKGCRLRRLEVAHPDVQTLRDELPSMSEMTLVHCVEGAFALRAEIETPSGIRVLGS